MFEGVLQPTHLVLILVIVLIIFGPGKLPGVGRAIGQSIRELRESSTVRSDPPPPDSTTVTISPAAEAEQQKGR